MKTANSILAIALLVMAGCGGGSQSTDELITVDVTKSYPEKELILQDVLDVEYVALETSDDYLCQGVVMAVGREVIIVKNRVDDGDIFVFDRKGKGLRKFNRKGKGAGEYMYISEIILDEDAGEMFVNDRQTSKILVYDLYGNYKQSIKYQEGISYNNLTDFDRESLICIGAEADTDMVNGVITISPKKPDKPTFVIISKQDGSIVRGIDIDYTEGKFTTVIQMINNGISVWIMENRSIIPERDGSWILTESSSDTIFRLLPDCSLTPLVVRTPPIQIMQPEVFLFPGILTDRYFFMKTERKDTPAEGWDGFPKTSLVCDLHDNSIYECTLLNGDWSGEKSVDIFRGLLPFPVSTGIVFRQRIEAFDLVEALEKGHLKGRLKEIAATLDEESNPVIMLVKHKKQEDRPVSGR